MLRIVAVERWSFAHEIVALVRKIGVRLTKAQPRELAVGNIVRRVLGIIREETEDDEEEEDSNSQKPSQQQQITSMFQILATPTSPSKEKKPVSAQHIKSAIIEEIRNLITEIQKVDDDIAQFAHEHIHSNEIILTTGYSATVQKFLIRAASVGKGPFTVIVAEGYPNDYEKVHGMIAGDPEENPPPASFVETSYLNFQRALTKAGITVIMIPDSAVFAMMSRVNKVILGTHAVTANGGLVAQAGTAVIARAAKEHRTPVVVVAGVYKVSPLHPFDFEGIAEAGNPNDALPWEDGEFRDLLYVSTFTLTLEAKFIDTVETVNVLYDYVPPELVDLYITNL